ncbi:hypothetical protein RNZ50_00410 [Paracoccaceae bacterium Fryx2]|nr:hypothetical protein [Paracoccaceae bacterium Fryx2]
MISVLMTVGDMPEARRAPVLAALHENLANPRVRDIHVMTEGSIGWMAEAAGAGASRLHLHPAAARPTFAALFGLGNTLLANGAGTVALMNGDISIATAGDAARMLEAFESLADLAEPVVLALSRHEAEAGVLQIALYDGSGLPNCLSADCWVFQTPVRVTRELFYAPGQMNCDMFLASDLLAAGYRLFNPCLDIVVKHHEPAKDDAFYAGKLQEDGVRNLTDRHLKQNGIDPFNYFGVPWTTTGWLRQGYRPVPQSTNRRRLMLAVPAGREDGIGGQIERLAALGAGHGPELQILCEGDIDRLVAANAALLARHPQIVVTKPQHGLAEVRAALLEGRQYSFRRLAFVGELSRLTPAVLAEAEGFFVGLGETEAPAGPAIGCTLITSVFRSDPFIRGFINNSLALEGYDRLVDHIFLVAKLSETEVAAFADLLGRQRNALVLWHQTDPGLYACWNAGIRMAGRTYVSNANVDDLRDPAQVVTLIRDLEMHPEALVAATAMNPFHDYPADGTLPAERLAWYGDRAGYFGFFDLAYLSGDTPPALVPHNMPHCMPMWRRSLHDRYGWFDEPRFGTFADWAFWLKVLRDGGSGWLEREALSFYLVNPTSHNRRGTDLDRHHAVVEAEFLADFVARREGRPAWATRKPATVPRKLNLTGHETFFGTHRNNFNELIHALAPLDRGDGTGCRLIPFVERQFVWGTDPGEARSDTAAPVTEDWVGILHVPFDAPEWYNPEVSPEHFLTSPLWRQSRPSCRGIITLCADLEADLRAFDPTLPTLAVRHPTEMEVEMFRIDAYLARPRVVQVGDWLRKLQAIHRLRAPGHERMILLKRWTENYLEHEVKVFGDHRDPAVTVGRMVPNEEYDRILSSSVVLCLMYATAANNVVVECIARATPLLINPLPAVVEYLGPGYPLYARDEAEADLLLSSPARVREAHLYLLQRRAEIDLTYRGFCREIAESEFYARL